MCNFHYFSIDGVAASVYRLSNKLYWNNKDSRLPAKWDGFYFQLCVTFYAVRLFILTLWAWIMEQRLVLQSNEIRPLFSLQANWLDLQPLLLLWTAKSTRYRARAQYQSLRGSFHVLLQALLLPWKRILSQTPYIYAGNHNLSVKGRQPYRHANLIVVIVTMITSRIRTSEVCFSLMRICIPWS